MNNNTPESQGVKTVALALSDLAKVDVAQNATVRAKLVKFMQESLQGIGFVIDDKNMASNTVYFYLNDHSSDIALALFDINGLEISAGSACSSGAAKPSAVLLQMGLNATAKNGLRLSMGFAVNEETLNKVTTRLESVFNKLRQS